MYKQNCYIAIYMNIRIWPCAKWTSNVGNIYTQRRTQESRDSKTRNEFFVQVRNLFITFELKFST